MTSLWLIAAFAARAARADDCVDGRVTMDGVEQSDLAAALAAADAGSTIEVCAGTYVGPFEATVPVELVAPDGPEDTVLDGAGAGSVLTLPGGSVVSGFTVTGGASPTNGGGLRLTSASDTLIEDCTFTGNRAVAGGGAVFVPDGSTLHARDSRFTGNTAGWGGGFLIGNRTARRPTVPNLGVVLDLEDSLVSENSAVGIAGSTDNPGGGGIIGYDATVVGGEVSDNTTSRVLIGRFGYLSNGGGLHLVGETELVDTVVRNNVADGSGGGIFVADGATALLEDVLVEGNESVQYAGGISAVSSLTAPIEVFAYGSEIRGNHANYNGGGLMVGGGVVWYGGEFTGNSAGSGGGLYIASGSHALADMEFIGNTALWYGGGAGGNSVSRSSSHTLSITDCVFEDNVAQRGTGGGLDLGQPATITGSRFRGNVAPDGGGLALYGWGSSAFPMPYTLVDLDLKHNEATASGGALLLDGKVAVTADDVDVKKNDAPVGGGANVKDGSITSVGGDWKNNDLDDVWVAKIAAGYADLEDFACTNAGCVELDE